MEARDRGSESWTAESGFSIKPEYTPADFTHSYAEALGAPGEFPFTRHVSRDGYRTRPWAPSLYSGFSEAASANERFRYLIAHGNGRVSIAFDLPTQLGLDSDHPRARHEVGRVGVAVDSLRDFETLLADIPLERTPVTMNMNALAPITVAMLAAVARQRNMPLDLLRGTISNDMLNEAACRGLVVWDLDASMRLLLDTAEFIIRRMPRYWPFNVRAALLHEIGATPAQELGIGLAIAFHYIDGLIERGISAKWAARRLSLFFATSPKFLEDVAKLRAARRMWATTLRESYGVEDRDALALRMTAVACNGSHFTREQPELNIVRSTLGVLACALGGAQTMVGTALDEAYEIPTEQAQQIALRVQQVVALESDVRATADPLGGSYFVEAMTDEVEAKARDVIEQVREWGGIEKPIRDGRIQDWMRDRAYKIQNQIDDGTRPVVGVNIHASKAAMPLEVWEPESDVRDRRVKEIEALRQDRDPDAVREALDELEATIASPDVNLMPTIIKAVESLATIGEISAAMSRAFGSVRIGLAG